MKRYKLSDLEEIKEVKLNFGISQDPKQEMENYLERKRLLFSNEVKRKTTTQSLVIQFLTFFLIDVPTRQVKFNLKSNKPRSSLYIHKGVPF